MKTAHWLLVVVVASGCSVFVSRQTQQPSTASLYDHLAAQDSDSWDERFRHGFCYAIDVLAKDPGATPMPKGARTVVKPDGTVVHWQVSGQ